MSAMPPKQGYAAGRRRREAALEAALQFVLENGHPSLTVRAIADAIGVTDAALFYYFPTKDHLLVELLRYREQHSVESELNLDGIDAIALGVENSQSTPTLVALFADMASRASDPQHPAHDFFDTRYAGLETYIATEAQARRPDLSPDEAADLARLYIAVTDGLQRRWLVHRDIDMGALARKASHSLFAATTLAPSAPLTP